MPKRSDGPIDGAWHRDTGTEQAGPAGSRPRGPGAPIRRRRDPGCGRGAALPAGQGERHCVESAPHGLRACPNQAREAPGGSARTGSGTWGALAASLGASAASLGLLAASLGLLAGARLCSRAPDDRASGYTIQQIDDLSRNLADSYIVMMTEACDRVLAETEDTRIEERVLWLKVGIAQSAVVLAVGPEPRRQSRRPRGAFDAPAEAMEDC